MVGMPTEDFLWESGEGKEFGQDKDELIHTSPVSYSPVHVHLQTGSKNYFCQSLLLFPIKHTPLMFQAHAGSIQGRCPEGLNELSFPISNGRDTSGSHCRGRAEPHLSSPPCVREGTSYIKHQRSRAGSRIWGQMTTMTVAFSKSLIWSPVKLPTIFITRKDYQREIILLGPTKCWKTSQEILWCSEWVNSITWSQLIARCSTHYRVFLKLQFKLFSSYYGNFLNN